MSEWIPVSASETYPWATSTRTRCKANYTVDYWTTCDGRIWQKGDSFNCPADAILRPPNNNIKLNDIDELYKEFKK